MKQAILVMALVAGSALAQDVRVAPEAIKAAWLGKKAIGKNANGVPVEFKMKEDGDAEVQAGNVYDRGKWRLTETGYCAKWYKLRAGKEACFTVVRRGDVMVVLNEDGTINTEIHKVE